MLHQSPQIRRWSSPKPSQFLKCSHAESLQLQTDLPAPFARTSSPQLRTELLPQSVNTPSAPHPIELPQFAQLQPTPSPRPTEATQLRQEAWPLYHLTDMRCKLLRLARSPLAPPFWHPHELSLSHLPGPLPADKSSISSRRKLPRREGPLPAMLPSSEPTRRLHRHSELFLDRPRGSRDITTAMGNRGP